MAPEAGEAYTQAYALCQQLGETPWLFEALWGLTLFHCIAGAVVHREQVRPGALRPGATPARPRPRAEGPFALGLYAFAHGDFVAARAHLEEEPGDASATPHSRPPPSSAGGFDHRHKSPLLCLAQVLWRVGLCRPGPAAESGGAGPGPAGGSIPPRWRMRKFLPPCSPSAAETWWPRTHMPKR